VCTLLFALSVVFYLDVAACYMFQLLRRKGEKKDKRIGAHIDSCEEVRENVFLLVAVDRDGITLQWVPRLLPFVLISVR
jgi:hypothetical protein